MAINATRGLPSFSEMYAAFKNRGSLAEAITGGLSAYNEGVASRGKAEEQAADIELKKAQAQEAMSKANKDPYAGWVDISLFEENLTPAQFKLLKSQATQVGDKFMINKESMSPYVSLMKEAGVAQRDEAGNKLVEKGLQDRKVAGEEGRSLAATGTLLNALGTKGPTPSAKVAGMAAKGLGSVVGLVSPKAGKVVTETLTPGSVAKAAKRDELLAKLEERSILGTNRDMGTAKGPAVPDSIMSQLQAGETPMFNRKTNTWTAVTEEEIADALRAGLEQGSY